MIVYRFVTSDTIDQRIIERAGAKRKLEKLVIQKGNFYFKEPASLSDNSRAIYV